MEQCVTHDIADKNTYQCAVTDGARVNLYTYESFCAAKHMQPIIDDLATWRVHREKGIE